MKIRFDVALNGVSFAELDDAIYLLDVQEDAPQYEISTAQIAMRQGMRVTSRVRRSLSVALRYMIRERDPAQRALIADRVAQWANMGGWLTINTRPGKRLYVTLESPPLLGSNLKWTGEIELTLVAYDRPYWEDAEPVVEILGPGQNLTGSITHDGTADAYAEAYIINKGTGVLTQATIRVGETQMVFTDLAVAAGDNVSIYYTDADILKIMSGTTSALVNRTPESDDNLIAKAGGSNAITVTADQPVQAVVMVRGRYL